jgi:hypothetical protein
MLDSLEALLHATWKTGDADLVAYAGNYVFEERVSSERQTSYERSPSIVTTGFDEWDRWHRNTYIWQAIHRETPETFSAINRDAAHSGDLAPEQYLVRVEGLEHALAQTRLELDELSSALESSRTAKDHGKYSAAEAIEAVSSVCDALNRNPYGVRPRFAGFLQDVDDSLSSSDWPNQVRDRFGLGHYKPNAGEVIPIAIMRYRVREILSMASARPEIAHPVCLPTVLDGQFSRFFVPAPKSLPYGRTLDLAGDKNCDRKIAEVLHPRLEYRPEHLFMVGAVTTGLDKLNSVGLSEFRSDHFFCLQYESDRNDFGAPPARWGTS